MLYKVLNYREYIKLVYLGNKTCMEIPISEYINEVIFFWQIKFWRLEWTWRRAEDTVPAASLFLLSHCRSMSFQPQSQDRRILSLDPNFQTNTQISLWSFSNPWFTLDKWEANTSCQALYTSLRQSSPHFQTSIWEALIAELFLSTVQRLVMFPSFSVLHSFPVCFFLALFFTNTL